MGPAQIPARDPERPRFGWVRGHPRLVAGAAAVVVLVLVVIILLASLLSSKGSGEPPLTQWQSVMSQVRDGAVSKDVALEAFSLAYKVSIPGVTLPTGVAANDIPNSGTGVVRWVDAHWKELSADQLAVVERYVIPLPDEVAVQSGVRLATMNASLGFDHDNCNRPLAHPEPAGMAAAYEADLALDVQRLAGELGLPGIPDVSVNFLDVDGGNTVFQTRALQGAICPYSPCNVFVYKNLWSQTGTAQNSVSSTVHVLLTHEAVHCLQFALYDDLTTGLVMPPWISEGSAIWIAAMDTQLSEPALPSVWTNGVFHRPDWSLTNRSYDAFGYYALLDHLGRPLFSLMKTAWKAAADTPAQRSQAFIDVLNGDASDLRAAWAPAHLREAGWGDPWITYGFGLPADAQVWRESIYASKTAPTIGQMESRSNFVREVQGSEGEIVHVEITTDGLANAHDGQGHEELAFTSKDFCVSGDCICPPSTLRAGDHVADADMAMPFDLAFNAPKGGATYSVYAVGLDDLCGKKAESPEPQPSAGFGNGSGGSGGGGCGSGCGGSNGDPHLVTIDGDRYDFQAAGEFTLLRSGDGSLEIQARQEPFETHDDISINTAIAAKVNGHRVGIYETPDSFAVHLDGQVSSTPTTDLGGGAKLIIHASGVEVDFPDGTILWALPTRTYGINAQVKASDALARDAIGILGRTRPGGMRVPALPDGTLLPAPLGSAQRHQLLYGQFADAWRLTDATSLFDYDPGRKTADYTKSGFPGPGADRTLEDLAANERARGETACDQITDPDLRNWCIFDVGVSSDAFFATGYSSTQQLLTAGPGVMDAPLPIPPSGPQPSTVAPSLPPSALTPVLTGLKGLHSSAIGPAGTVYIVIERLAGGFQVVSIDPTRQQVEQMHQGTSFAQVVVAAGSAWVSGGGGADPCTITRLDAGTLQVQATLTIPCAGFGASSIATLGDAVWFVDQTSLDPSGAKPKLRRIDPATNQPDAGVDLPFLNGFLRSSESAIFYWDSQVGWYRLEAGETAFVKLGASGVGVTGGSMVWVTSPDGDSVQAFSGPGGPTQTVAIDGSVVAADSHALYLERSGATQEGLWRALLDGSPPTQLLDGASVTVGQTQRDLGFFDDYPPLLGSGLAVKLWPVVENAVNPQGALFVETALLP